MYLGTVLYELISSSFVRFGKTLRLRYRNVQLFDVCRVVNSFGPCMFCVVQHEQHRMNG